jgi:hypothetical protein
MLDNQSLVPHVQYQGFAPARHRPGVEFPGARCTSTAVQAGIRMCRGFVRRSCFRGVRRGCAARFSGRRDSVLAGCAASRSAGTAAACAGEVLAVAVGGEKGQLAPGLEASAHRAWDRRIGCVHRAQRVEAVITFAALVFIKRHRRQTPPIFYRSRWSWVKVNFFLHGVNPQHAPTAAPGIGRQPPIDQAGSRRRISK